jgi:glycine cleavage system H protein
MVALFVILFFVLLIAVDLIIQMRKKEYPLMSTQLGSTNPSRSGESLRVPKGIFFHPGHTWARMQSGNRVFVGIDDFLQKSFGSIESVSLPAVGSSVQQGDAVISLVSANRTISVVAPIDGTIWSINDAVIDNPALIHDNPYKDGWLFSVYPEDLAHSLSALSIAETAVSWIKNEIIRFREFVVSRTASPELLGETMLDGGVAVSGSLQHLDDDALKEFEQDFLR